jgi:hypothetical protein
MTGRFGDRRQFTLPLHGCITQDKLRELSVPVFAYLLREKQCLAFRDTAMIIMKTICINCSERMPKI